MSASVRRRAVLGAGVAAVPVLSGVGSSKASGPADAGAYISFSRTTGAFPSSAPRSWWTLTITPESHGWQGT